MKQLLLLALLCAALPYAQAEICGKEDDRTPSFDPRVGRMVKAGATSGCSTTLISNSCVITVGSCALNRDYVEFNVPQSIAGVPQVAAEKDRYYIDPTFFMYEKDGIGHDWAVIKLKKNELTNLDAGQVQSFYKVAKKKAPKNTAIKLIAYSYALNDLYDIRTGEVPPNKYPDVLHYAQSAARGTLIKSGIFLIPEILEHTADSTYGSGGAPIVNEATDEVLGITTHGGCRATYTNPMGARFTNSGTSITGSKKFREAVNKCLSL